MPKLEIKNLHVSIEGKKILKGLDLIVNQEEIHALMGPNGSGKSTLAFVLMGHPNYKIEEGDILFDGQSILKMKPNERARLGLFLAFQYPYSIPGVSVFNFLRTAYTSIYGETKGKKEKMVDILQFSKMLSEKMKLLKIDSEFSRRYLNDGFSGGEKKKAEILQMAILNPKIAVLDETDSGTDVDAMKVISQGINEIQKQNKSGMLLITHYNRILHFVKPDFVHVMIDGKIVKSGDAKLADEVETKGYEVS
jgi:Fe-S cluster assembly ATP-binding protein